MYEYEQKMYKANSHPTICNNNIKKYPMIHLSICSKSKCLGADPLGQRESRRECTSRGEEFARRVPQPASEQKCEDHPADSWMVVMVTVAHCQLHCLVDLIRSGLKMLLLMVGVCCHFPILVRCTKEPSIGRDSQRQVAGFIVRPRRNFSRQTSGKNRKNKSCQCHFVLCCHYLFPFVPICYLHQRTISSEQHIN